MRPGTIVSTMLAITITVSGFAIATATIRPAAVATLVVRRAWFLADLARLDVLLTRAAARVVIDEESAGSGLRIRWSESGVSVRVDGQEHRFDRVRIESIEHAINPVQLLHVKVFDPYRRDGERWHLIAPFARRRVP